MSAGYVLAFRAAGERLAVPLERVREAARLVRLTPLPGAPAEVAGVTLHRGEPIGVLDVARSIGGPPAGETSGFLVVLRGTPLALLVEKLDGVEEGDAEGVRLLDVDALLPRDEGVR